MIAFEHSSKSHFINALLDYLNGWLEIETSIETASSKQFLISLNNSMIRWYPLGMTNDNSN